ncbi:hypothetical protein [Sphingomonas bacterium]|uniref:hypothetical protein n=1 Tax=Sphingomonas bacterium TaxID=1895847 RepID=UPI0026019938|nr:hypothetical protein [Sphingomonas bacterium]
MAWDVHGRLFRFTASGDRLALETSDGRLSLTLHEWQGVTAALAALHPPAPPRLTVAPGTIRRSAWTAAEDQSLCHGWYGGEGLAALALALDRSEGAIVARLVRLDCVAGRQEARRRP